jgi:hypothetical protein
LKTTIRIQQKFFDGDVKFLFNSNAFKRNNLQKFFKKYLVEKKHIVSLPSSKKGMLLEKHRLKKIFKNFENNFGQNDKKLLPLQPQTKG